jgi:hypothetical protein
MRIRFRAGVHRDMDTAVALLREALALYPESADAGSWRAWARRAEAFLREREGGGEGSGDDG